ncbi:helix-turn-helix domain-containing protein [Thermoactinomyces sp. CICC 10521]|uniref:helix-turn-helix domain-containing protein n=1 Tax=Thermoactinomyces sp. CICC 10521 TaxID=2767426 RepID=UPI0018DE33F9|nr:helix-turn-helix domain-containing protein [Thermoactinomyces sp. CICC 10521]MBH8608913.1 helix-turn-helix domain-containing protein [Thermoactinomyces sp. CICC 10521]
MRNHSLWFHSFRTKKFPTWMKKTGEILKTDVLPEVLDALFEPKEKKKIEEWLKPREAQAAQKEEKKEQPKRGRIAGKMATDSPQHIAFARHRSGKILSLIREDNEEAKDSLSTPMMVVGRQGSGKSTLFVNMTLEFFGVRAKNRKEWEQIARSVFLFDVADGAMLPEILSRVPEWLRDRVVILNHADMEHVVPIAWHDLMKLYQDDESIAAEVAEIETELLRKFLQDDSQTISIERYLKSALQTSYRVGEGNLLDAIRILKDGEYRQELMESLSETDFELEIALNQLDEETEKENSRVLETIENRISQLRANKRLFYSLSQTQEEQIDFWKWMNEPHLVLIHIPNSKESFQDFAFTHYIVKLWRMMMAREMIPKPDRRECAVIVDEIDLIIKNKPVQNIFLQMTKKPRKYRTKFIFSFHDWSSFSKAGQCKNDIIRSFKTGMDMVLLKGSGEVFEDFEETLEPFTGEDFHTLGKYQGIMRITCNKKEYVFRAKLLEPASERMPSFSALGLGNQFGMAKVAITQRAREILLPLYAKKSEEKAKSENITAKDKVLALLRESPGLTTKEICEELDISRMTFQRIKKELKIQERKDGKKLVYFV